MDSRPITGNVAIENYSRCTKQKVGKGGSLWSFRLLTLPTTDVVDRKTIKIAPELYLLILRVSTRKTRLPNADNSFCPKIRRKHSVPIFYVRNIAQHIQSNATLLSR